ncbi:hypothetical protein TIFTF001_018869 [Ficus carica]|uniref:NB-ARC domain-containing protein n=1 Tax=Ficus carica TaxID=3494 RepID=A0AA88AC97_FICCA|nr:hypothetical protein TIFTF001_018869 [Ficus carica]
MKRWSFPLVERQEETPVPLTRRPETDSFDVFPVLPVVGMGGLGKTALAQLVFNDEMVQDQFELRSWVHVGDNVEFGQILLQLQRQITDSGPQNIEMDEALINQRSREIVTTRIRKFEEIISTAAPYLLGLLGEDVSWSLFQRMAFQNPQEWDSFSNMELPNVVELVGGGIMETLGLRIAVFESCPSLDTAARFEPPNNGTKTRCLTTWACPIQGQLVQEWLNCIEKILQGADDLLVKLHGETLQSSMMVENKIIKSFGPSMRPY